MTKSELLIIDAQDNVAVALKDISKGEWIAGILFKDSIPIYHKVAIQDISCGHRIIKYGESIGVAARDIKTGEHVHTHNLRSND